MDTLFDSLISKTFFIVGTQIFVTFLATYYLIRHFRLKYLQHHPDVTATRNEDGELDLQVSWPALTGPFYTLLVLDIITFVILLFYGRSHPFVGYLIFCFWSLLTGFEIALALLSIDENLGLKALRLTALITLSAALIGMYTNLSFASLGGILFVGLSALVAFEIVRLFRSFSNRSQLIGSAFGALLFTFYLAFDFNRLENMDKNGWNNSWGQALDVSINIYLDVINLFLRIVEILGRSRHH